MITVRQPPIHVGCTQASSVSLFVRSSVAASATDTRLDVPLNRSAAPNRPAGTHVAPAIVPMLPFPDASPAVEPAPSSNPYAATSPAGTAAFETLTVTGADSVEFPAPSRATAV